MTDSPSINKLPDFSRPYDWQVIDEAVRGVGGVILKSFMAPADVRALNADFDRYLQENSNKAAANSGSDLYNDFLGHKTLRLHGLVEKVPATRPLIGSEDLISWAERMMAPVSNSVQLSAGEMIQIQPGEPAQFPHRDSDSWSQFPLGGAPIVVNAIIALDATTEENGATHVAPGSWEWDAERTALPQEFTRAVMDAGDAVLFRGDTIHGGGANNSQNRRRVLSVSYCAGWLRPVENNFLNVSPEIVRTLPTRLQDVLGYAAYDGIPQGGGMIGLYEGGDPHRALAKP